MPILNKKDLDTLPPRVLRFRLRLARFAYTVSHVPGKHLCTADTLSRAPVSAADEKDNEEAIKTKSFMESMTSFLPAKKSTLETYKEAQHADKTCSQLITFCKNGWPSRD